MISKKHILVAPLNWGLGHATRCMPIINELLQKGFHPIIASDGDALLLLQKEFPKLLSVQLPSYNIQYPKNKSNLRRKLLSQLPGIYKTIKAENSLVNKLITDFQLSGIISDNRLGVRSSKVPSVYITHQTHVFSGVTTYFSTRIHQYFINLFNECWIPDYYNEQRLSGLLSETKGITCTTKRIGNLSRFKKKDTPIKYDISILLSGLEPYRSQFEDILLKEFENSSKRILLVRGVLTDNTSKLKKRKSIDIVDFLLSEELEEVINESKMIIARSGYSTILDLSKLNKKAFFVPTPGQDEQEYLASYLSEKNIAPFCAQNEFKAVLVDNLSSFKGFSGQEECLPQNLFNLF